MARTSGGSRFLGAMVLTAAMAVAGCNGPDRAGGDATDQTVVLTFAQPNEGRPTQLDVWADEVSRVSGGSMQIQFEDAWRQGQLDYEIGTIGDVRTGKVDMAGSDRGRSTAPASPASRRSRPPC